MPVPLTRAARGRSAAPLPDPFPALATSPYKVRLRKGQVVMVAGPPGAGKTVWALAAVLAMRSPCLYISADSDEDTMAARAAANLTGHPIDSVLQTIQYGLYAEEYGPVLRDCPIRFEYEPSDPSLQDISNSLTAWLELNGKYPDVLVLDNLMNLATNDGNEWQGMRQAVKDLHYLARKLRICVIVLHHTSEQDPGHIQSAPPRSAIQGKVSQLPALVLTLANNGSELYVAVVKNRHGPADPLAKAPVVMIVDFSCCRVRGRQFFDGIIAQSARGAA